MKFGERIVYFIGILIIILGFIMTAGSIGNMVDPENEKSTTEWIIWTVLLGIIPMVAGFLICRKMKLQAKNRDSESLERQLLQLAKSNKGRLTIAEVSMNMAISSAEAKNLLDECHLNNLADIEASDSGVVTYTFNISS
ncbi:MAG: hypothetical protein DWQ05_07330 [Calditrichaeota bacterium]|nr:MAG: hypothetical protein DWQ05_07330 [Calditrichota bacterium]